MKKVEISRLRASGKDGRAKPLGAAIAGTLESGEDCVDVEGIGASAVNNMVKAIAIANTMMKQDGHIGCYCVPEFFRRSDSKGQVTLILMHVYSFKERSIYD